MRTFFRRIKSTKPVNSGIDLRRGPFRSDGLDRIYPEHRTRVSATARITGPNGLVEQASCHPMGSQLMGRKRRAGDRFARRPYADDVVCQTENRWDTPRKRALFGLDGLVNMTSGSDVVEVQDYGDLDGDALNVALLMPESQGWYREFYELPVGRLRISTPQYSCRWCGIGSLTDRPSVHYADTSIVLDPILRCRTLWTAVVCGKFITRPGFVVTMAQAEIRHGRFTR